MVEPVCNTNLTLECLVLLYVYVAKTSSRLQAGTEWPCYYPATTPDLLSFISPAAFSGGPKASSRLSWQPAVALCQACIVSAAMLYSEGILPPRPSFSPGATVWQGETPLEQPVPWTEPRGDDLTMLQGCMAPSALSWGCWQRFWYACTSCWAWGALPLPKTLRLQDGR